VKTLYKGSSNKSGIYAIYCVANFGVYIGSTNCFKRRRMGHLSALRGNKHHCKHLQNAWTKHGENSFVFQVVELTSVEEKLLVEQKYLNLHFDKNYCYNSNPVAKFSNEPVSVKSKQQLKKIYSRIKTVEEKKKISNSHKKIEKISWKNRQYTDCRIVYGVDSLIEKGLFPRGIDFSPDEIEALTKEAIIAYRTFPYHCANNPQKTQERIERKRDFKLWLEYQGIWVDKRKDSWNRKSESDKEAARRNLAEGSRAK